MDCTIKTYDQLTAPELAALYETARAERLLPIIGYDADDHSWPAFAAFARLAPVLAVGYRSDGRAVGFVYLSHFEGATARIHFAVFKAGRERRLELGRLALGWCFERFGLAALVGLAPSFNVGAIGFARALGGREMGQIPGACWVERRKRFFNGVQFLFLPEV